MIWMADGIEQRGFEDHTDMEERRKICMNALLNRPWIERDKDPQLYHWAREQYLEIRNWFAKDVYKRQSLHIPL